MGGDDAYGMMIGEHDTGLVCVLNASACMREML